MVPVPRMTQLVDPHIPRLRFLGEPGESGGLLVAGQDLIFFIFSHRFLHLRVSPLAIFPMTENLFRFRHQLISITRHLTSLIGYSQAPVQTERQTDVRTRAY